jgi:hypothetical protein
MSDLTPPPTSSRAPGINSQRPVALSFLDAHLEHGGLDVEGYDMLCGVLRMFGEISLLLFPPSHSLEPMVMRRVKVLSNHIAGTFHILGEHIDTHLKRARLAMHELPDLAVVQEDHRRHNLKVWRRKLR